jgi:D-alanyl-D-alanine carboxypeptidase/D-alanyl-D-alanine-endopeptidase (penicillin-binding protein 4)
MRTPLAFAWLAPLVAASLQAQPNPVCARIQALTAASPAHWGVSVTALDGTPICQLDDAKLFRPASNNKLLTTAAALAILGPNDTFETRVTGNLDARTGVVQGDLTLVGGGDANLDSGDLPYNPHPPQPAPPFAFHDLEDLAAQLAAKGVKAVTGDIVGDDTLFPYQPYVGSWELEDIVGNDGPPVSALTIADNQVKLTVTPETPNTPATVTLDQHGVPFYTVMAQIETRPAKADAGFQIERYPRSRTLHVYGSIAADTPPESEEVSIDEPAVYAAMALRQMLLAHGISVAGTTRAEHKTANLEGEGFLTQLHVPLDRETRTLSGESLPSSCLSPLRPATLASLKSASLAEDVVYTDKVSQNLHAELLLHALGRVVPCFEGSTASGARMIRAFLLKAGLNPDDFLLYDGSGLSSHDLVAPRALTQLLSYAALQPWFPDFKAALPVGGTDGSLRSRFNNNDEPALKGRVFAKTGSLGESRALSGYLTAASGQTLVFSLMDDNHPPATTDDRTLMDRILALIAAAN